MSSSVEGSSADPLLPPTQRTTTLDQIPAWHSARGNRRNLRWNSRWNLLALGVLTATAFTALLTWAATSIGRAPHVCLILASSDYHSNLNLPANAMGDRAIGRLAAWATAGDMGIHRNVQLARPPLELANKKDFEQIETDRDAAVALIYLSVHGIHTPQGPALLAADAESIDDAYPVQDLLDRIARFPENQKKVLLLDCVHFASQPSWGILLNDFAGQIRELDPAIQAIPNLVVLISSDRYQQSWINPAAGTTNWAAALTHALNGGSQDLDRDGWIDLLEVQRAASDETSAWANKICQQPQTPLLLPLGSRGELRSRNLGLFPAKTPAIEIPALVTPSNQARVAKWWTQHDQFAAQSLHPAVISPAVWRRFEQTLLRYEHFEFAGSESGASVLNDRLEDLANSLQRPTRIDSVACRAGVLPPEMAGFHVSPELRQTAQSLATLLAGMSIDDAADHWLSVAAKQPSATHVAFLRRAIIQNRADEIADAFRMQVSVDRDRLHRAAALVTTLTDPLQPIPQLGQVLQFLARDLPSEPLGSADATRVARFLDLSSRCDRVASKAVWWSPEQMRWVQPLVAATDRQRRFAGDLLVGEPEARQRSEECLKAAELGYAKIDQISSVVSAAETIVAQGSLQLARLRQLTSAGLIDTDHDEHAIPTLYATLDQVSAILNSEVPANESQRNGKLQQLQTLTGQFHDRLGVTAKRVDTWQRKMLGQHAQSLPEMIAAIQSIGGTASARRAAWESVSRLAAGGDNTLENLQSIEHNTSVATLQRIAARRGQLALASWPATKFDTIVTGVAETRAQVEHRFEVFATDAQWTTALSEAGYQIGLRENAARHLAQTPVKRRTADEDIQLRNRLFCIQRMAAPAPYESQHFVTALRSHAFAGLLAWQTHRFVADGYWSLRQEGPAYYARLAELLTGDLTSLSLRVAAPSCPLLTDPESAVTLQVPKTLVWTTQRTDQFSVNVGTVKNGAEGFATLWVEATGSLQISQPADDQRVCRPLAAPAARSQQNVSPPSDGLIVHLQHRDNANTTETAVRVHGYFRGRRLTVPVAVEICDTPDVHIVDNPRPHGGRIAIRSETAVSDANNGAITLVLDCSGSMGANRGEAFGPDTKYAHAVAAISELLDDLPRGVKLSVWTFGQAVGDNKTVVPAERSIRRIQPPIAWDPRDASLRQNLIDAISYPNVEPWNESPLLAAVLAASSDLRDVEGVRSLVVITDGADNRIADDAVANPLGLAPEQWIRKQFSGTGITVNVIGFRIDNENQADTESQLATVEDLLPPGRFVTAERTSELAAALGQMLSVEEPIAIRPAASTNGTKLDPIASVPISPAESAAAWTPALDAGLYAVAAQGHSSDTLIQVADGDRLILNRSAAGTLTQWPTIDQQFRWCPQRRTGRWTIAMSPQPVSASAITARQLVLWAPSAGGSLAIQRPGELWIEARDGDRTLPIRWQTNHDLSSAAYDLAIQAATTGQPQLNVWVSDRTASSAGALVRKQDFWHLQDLAPANWQLSEGEIQLKSATIETHDVADRSGNLQPQPCLVLRGSGPRSIAFRMRTRGLAFEGQDEQCFTELGQFTLRQWPVTQADVERSLQAVELILVDQVQRDTERSGGKLIFAAEPPPVSVTHNRNAGDSRSVSMGASR